MDEQYLPRGRAAPWDVRGKLDHLRVGGMLALTVAYFAAAQVGYALDLAGPVGSIVWFPAGVGIAFLALGGPGLWPGALIGDLLVNDYGALPLGTALAQSIGNVLEVV